MKELLEKYWLMSGDELGAHVSDAVTQIFTSVFIVLGAIVFVSLIVLALAHYAFPYFRNRWINREFWRR